MRDYQAQLLHPGENKRALNSLLELELVKLSRVLLWVGASVYPSNDSTLHSAGFFFINNGLVVGSCKVVIKQFNTQEFNVFVSIPRKLLIA